MTDLRPYQIQALDQIRGHYAKGEKKVLLHLATGGGKTVVFCEILKSSFNKGKKALMIVRGRKLVDQASQRLIREFVPHGVLMANHWNYRPHERVQIASIDTLRSRGLRPDADIIVIDEAHLATSPSYVNFLKQYPDAYMLPVTATPYMDQSLSHCAEHVVFPITAKELIKQGFLVPPRHFCTAVPDTSGVKTDSHTKDFNNKQLAVVMDRKDITGDLIEHYREIAIGKPALCFAVSIDHSKHIVEEFNNAGIPARHCDANSSDEERNQAIKDLKNGTIYILSNVGLFGIGVDLPFLACIIMARPTKSYILYIQQAGRGSRPHAETGKKNYFVLDHAGNFLRHGNILDEQEANLTLEKKTKKGFAPKICRICFLAFTSTYCPECGPQEKDKKPREYMHVDGKLKEITEESFEQKVHNFIKDCKKTAKNKGYKKGWVFYQLVDKYGPEVANKFMPKRNVPDWILNNVSI